MNKRLLSIIIAGLTLLANIRAASAAGNSAADTTRTIQVDGINIPIPPQTTAPTVNRTTVPSSTTVTPPVTAPTATTPRANGIIPPGVGTTVGTAAQGIVTRTVTTAGTNAIQSGNQTLTNTAAQQTAGISATLSKIPLVGGMANGVMQQKIAAGISDLTTMANKAFTNLMNDPKNPLGGIGKTIAGFFGGGNDGNPNNANSQATAQATAIQATTDNYGRGATQAATILAKQANPNIGNINTALASTTPASDISSAVTNTQAQQDVAKIAVNTNPANGSLNQLDSISATSSKVIAESANGVSGQAALQSRVLGANLNAAGMQYHAAQTYDNSLDQLNAISQQIGQHGAISAEGIRIAAEQRTLSAAQLSQASTDATARIRRQETEDRASQRLTDEVQNTNSIIQGMVGAVKPKTTTTSPTPARNTTNGISAANK
jgi:hypothetical protein